MPRNLNGAKYIDCCMMSKAPVDLLIITLGTNDTKEFFNANAHCIARGLEQLILKARGGQYGHKGESPQILIISPQPLRDNISQKWPAEVFGNGCLEKARAIPVEYQKMAKKYQCHFLDMARLVESSDLDGVHLDVSNHEKFALAVYKKVLEIFNGAVEETNE